MKNKKGISLIVLVITIIVMIILAAAIILSLNSSNIIERANQATLESDMKTMQEELAVVLAEAILDGTVDEIEGKPAEEVLDSAKNYQGMYIIQNGKLVEIKEIEPVVEQGDFKYTYNETYGGYEVAPLEQKTSYNEIASDINGTPVVAIADRAFYEHYELEEILLPSSITIIGKEAFMFTALNSINSSNIKVIKDSAFSECSSLETFDFSNVESIGVYAFNCTGLREAYLTTNLKYISGGAFVGACWHPKIPEANVINYAGTMEQWNALGCSFNNGSEIICSDGTITY